MKKNNLKKNIAIGLCTAALLYPLSSAAYAETEISELPVSVANLLNNDNYATKTRYKMPSYLKNFDWHNSLTNRADNTKILDTLWDSKVAENKITASNLISTNANSYAVYTWLTNRVAKKNDLELAFDLIQMVKLKSKKEAAFWLHYYTLSGLEDGALCINESKRKQAISDIFNEAKHLYKQIDINQNDSTVIAEEVISYAKSRSRAVWSGACSSSKAQLVEDAVKRAQIKNNIRTNYITLFKQNVL